MNSMDPPSRPDWDRRQLDREVGTDPALATRRAAAVELQLSRAVYLLFIQTDTMSASSDLVDAACVAQLVADPREPGDPRPTTSSARRRALAIAGGWLRSRVSAPA